MNAMNGPRLAVALVVALAGRAHGAATTRFVGVLEDHARSGSPGEGAFRVRVAFWREPASGWRALPIASPLEVAQTPDASSVQAQAKALGAAMPRQVSWTVCFDGRRLGSVVSHLADDWAQPHLLGTQVVERGPGVPTVGPRSEAFAGWRGEPVHRPLVVTSPGSCSDPDGWRPGTWSGARDERRRRALSAAGASGGVLFASDRATIDASTVVKRAYRSRHGAFILSCSAPEGEGATFVVSPAGDVKYLGNALTLIDAGDYDGDGSAELVFMYEREDLDGYVLFDGAFTHHQAFGWQYH